MTDKTKQIFAAPWKTMPEDPGIVQDENGAAVAICVSPEVANAFSRLPELYDALMEAAYEHCRMCLYRHVERVSEMPSPNDMAKNGCQISDYPHCPNKTWWGLLRKVRDGK